MSRRPVPARGNRYPTREAAAQARRERRKAWMRTKRHRDFVASLLARQNTSTT